ncbi:unnamed protein product [Microthlaspi erraticum]|uniref:Reverse transcriptase domain-containing protein n=1 Tax=Microthlaspi erraticum TaxID=1685480 RepID=A0A6D2JYR3_9BRAS|nr:unnamed protein product [Microthlaspi erraticum]
MTSIFSDLIEEMVEVFMDDFSVYGASFSLCEKVMTLQMKKERRLIKKLREVSMRAMRMYQWRRLSQKKRRMSS